MCYVPWPEAVCKGCPVHFPPFGPEEPPGCIPSPSFLQGKVELPLPVPVQATPRGPATIPPATCRCCGPDKACPRISDPATVFSMLPRTRPARKVLRATGHPGHSGKAIYWSRCYYISGNIDLQVSLPEDRNCRTGNLLHRGLSVPGREGRPGGKINPENFPTRWPASLKAPFCPAGNCNYRPTSFLMTAALSVFSQGRSNSGRPKWP